MNRILSLAALSVGLLAPALGFTQTHKVARPESVVRAVGVFEWTGDLAKPTASRLIPVSLAINGDLEDAGIYLARPIPFALLPGNDYLLQVAGIDHGSVALLFARHLSATADANSAWEDGWFGYGTYRAMSPSSSAKQPVLRASKTNPIISGSQDNTRPHFSNKGGSSTKDSSSASDTKPSDTSNADSDRPHLTRKDDAAPKADTGSGQGTETAGSSDADRPTMRRRSPDAQSGTAASAPATDAGTPADDPDRPSLKRHTAGENKKGTGVANDTASVTGTGSLNADPDRPNLHRGKPASALTEADLPKLSGLPSDLHQMVAVSDAVNRPSHDFTRPWDDSSDRASILSGMQTFAREQLASGGSPKASQLALAVRKAAGTHSTARGPAHPVHTAAPSEPLLDEDLRAYTLSYGGLPTFVYSAHTAGEGATLRYVTVVAQKDAMGTLKPALRTSTDAAHLDTTPRFRLVDVVDADASNRASLLFELRAQASRQFALYRVLGTAAEQIFVTGSTQ